MYISDAMGVSKAPLRFSVLTFTSLHGVLVITGIFLVRPCQIFKLEFNETQFKHYIQY
jgi:hypothetical protein